ncbi:ATP-grasp fold amidoligase family protein [Pelotomaculum propionicicum]|uniref:ATP-grasp fold amidoligase family protein n=1 Tax=Pelotomaculum propionicicum TaxID=258475 RepID=UPI003B80A05C
MDLNSVLKLIKKPQKIVRYLGNKNFFCWLSDTNYLKLIYRCETGKKLNLDKPLTFNEKLQWLKLYDRNPEYCTYVDKFEVRSYIKNTIGEKYLIPLIDVYDKTIDIPWDTLPDRFVLKCTHGSGCNIICYDKSRLNIEESTVNLNRWMKMSWYWFGREWPYKNLKSRIVCETFISDTDKTPDDYKVLCFNGKAKLIEVHIDRYGNHTQDFYDSEWNKTTISQGSPTSKFVCDKPPQLKKMIQLSEQLASNMRHVRIDWFVVQDKLYFGEITFYDSSGFDLFGNEEDDYLLGSWIDLGGVNDV